MFSLALKGASTDVAWIGGVGALSARLQRGDGADLTG
jgi:hypothetical protein